MNIRRKFKVYCDGCFLGETYAVSAAHAISMVRYRRDMLYKPMENFTAKIAYIEGTHEYDTTETKPIIVNSEPVTHQISFNELIRGLSNG